MTIQELFIANLKAYRKLRKISQMQLAELCDASTGYMGEIESGKCFPSIKMIERIAAAFEIESWHLFKNEPESLAPQSDLAKLAPSQKLELMKMANSALSKILDEF